MEGSRLAWAAAASSEIENRMDLPARVIIFCPTLDLKNKPGRLMAVSSQGYYEVWLDFADRNHTVLLPINGTALVFAEPNSTSTSMPGIERTSG